MDRLIQPRSESRTGKQKMAVPGSNFSVDFGLNYDFLRMDSVFLPQFKEDGHIIEHPDENTAPT